MRLGLIARSDATGLGNQTRNLAYMLKPSKILVINSSSFSKQSKQRPQLYEGFNAFTTAGWPTNHEVRSFLKEIDVLLSCETFYNPLFITEAKRLGIRTILQFNWEFLDNLQDKGYPRPDIFVAPSLWNYERLSEEGLLPAIHLPPPTDQRVFAEARNENWPNRHRKYLHIQGRKAHLDRNGTEIVLESLKHSKEDFTLVIKTQGDFDPLSVTHDDHRIIWDYSKPDNEAELYKGFDALIMPRRYGGLCLPMNEALMSGLPVIMPDCDPNNKILPQEWLGPVSDGSSFMARTLIDVRNMDAKWLGNILDTLTTMEYDELDAWKGRAFDIGYNMFSYDALRDQYMELLAI